MVISEDTMLSRALLDNLKIIYISPAYQNWSEPDALLDNHSRRRRSLTLGSSGAE